MLRVLNVERDVAGIAAGRLPGNLCEHPVPMRPDSMGGVTIGFCNRVVQDAARLQGLDDPFTRYLCRTHGDAYAAMVAA